MSEEINGVTGISPELIHDPFGEDILDTSSEEFEALLAEHGADFKEFRRDQLVEATVLRVDEGAVILEFGFKSEGAVALDEFKDPPSPGDKVEVLLESLEDDDGVVVLSKRKADFHRVWEEIREAFEQERPLHGTLTRKIKGGVTVDLMGVEAFLPGSQIALRRVQNIEDLVGESYDFKIIKLNRRRRNVVVSRRVLLEAERAKERATLVRELLVGQVREGQVKNITDFGAFIDLGGLDGLLHITDMSWGRVGHPSEVIEVGKCLDVKVLDVDWSRERISLGLKQLLPYPWREIDRKYPIGARVRGRVVSITNYGVFVELEKGVEGLVHISEMSWTRNVRHPSKVVDVGQELEAVVLKVDPKEEKISLGMKQIAIDPWLTLATKFPTGTKLSGTVRNLTAFGAFVEIEPGIDGLVHVSDMSWTRRVDTPSQVVHKGQEVEVIVLEIDGEQKRVSLGMRQLHDDPWPELADTFQPGTEVEGSVLSVERKGLVVSLGDEVDGFVPASRAGLDDRDQLASHYDDGVPVSLRVTEFDGVNHRIILEVTERPEAKSPPDDEADDEADEAEDADGAEEPVAEDESGEPEGAVADDQADEDADEAEDADGAEEVVAEDESAEPEGAEAEEDAEGEADADGADEADAEDESGQPEGAEAEEDAEGEADADGADEADAEDESGEPEGAVADEVTESEDVPADQDGEAPTD